MSALLVLILFCFVLFWLVGCLVVVVVGGGDDVDRHGIDAEASVAGFQ